MINMDPNLSQRQKNEVNSFNNTSLGKLKDKGKKTGKLIKLLKNPVTRKIILVSLLLVLAIVIGIILIAAFKNLIGGIVTFGFAKAKDAEINTAISYDENNTSSQVNGDFLQTAQELWDEVSKSDSQFTTYGNSSVPCTGNTIDCSSFVSWVLYKMGYEDFKGEQHYTWDFYNTDLNKEHGLYEEKISGNVLDKIQVGDILVRERWK